MGTRLQVTSGFLNLTLKKKEREREMRDHVIVSSKSNAIFICYNPIRTSLTPIPDAYSLDSGMKVKKISTKKINDDQM